MKILFLYRNDKKWGYNHWINFDSLNNLAEMPEVELKTYGPGMPQIMNDKNLIPYDKNISMKNLQTRWSYDIILIGHKNRMFFTTKEKETWLPRDFKSISTPKVMLEPDYHNYRKRNAPFNWIEKNNIIAILHRHKNNVIRGTGDFPDIHHCWLPMSVDPDIFKPTFKKRINKICFVGSGENRNYYRYRTLAAEKLKKAGLLINEGKIFENKYINCLQSYVCHLSASSIYNIDPGKMFEIMASGSVLLTDVCYNGTKDLFPLGSYVTYKRDYSDLIEKAKYILDHPEERKKIIEKGRQCILDRHTHEHRAKELYKILQQYVDEPTIEIIEKPKPKTLDVVYNVGDLDKEAIKRFKCSYYSLRKNENYNICISEVGKKSHKEIFDTFIPEYSYYFEKSEDFNASVSKNNAFKYLIQSELFAFIDIDLVMSETFVKDCLDYYEQKKKPFVLSYVRLPKMGAITYKGITRNIKNTNCVIRKGIGSSGIIACDQNTYRDLNGFDEDYKGWGARDSDFNLRAFLCNKITSAPNIILYHLYHSREWMRKKLEKDNVKEFTSNKNHIRYRKREKLYKNKQLNLWAIKGLKDLTEIDNKEIIKKLMDEGVTVCLLKKACRDWVLHKTLPNKITIGVSSKERALEVMGSRVNIKLISLPEKTKEIGFEGYRIKVPFPVTAYLIKNYGAKIVEKIKNE